MGTLLVAVGLLALVGLTLHGVVDYLDSYEDRKNR